MTTDPIDLAMKAGQEFDSRLLVYKSTNEDLTSIFDKYDVKDKDVLTVLASSDQALSCFYKGAKTIDTFDRSYITLFYYYLRKWLIIYKNELYPSNKFLSFKGSGDKELYELVCSIKPEDRREKEAQTFWKKYMEFNDYKANFLFEDRYCNEPKPFNNKIDKIKDFYNKPINFTLTDITEPINIHKKYDVIILSNIFEYKESMLNQDTIRYNLENLLKENGLAICSYKLRKRKDKCHQDEILTLTKGTLSLDSEYKHYEPLAGKNIDLAYAYRKRSK